MKHATATGGLSEQVEQNLDALVAIQRRQWEQLSPAQHRIERLSRAMGRPLYLLALCLFTALWIAYNLLAPGWGIRRIDPFPFPLLDGLLSLAALIGTTVVLIAQNLQTKLEKQHTHLALQITLLTEQKVSKVIHLLEELRRDMPMVDDRRDPQLDALKTHTNAADVLTAIEQVGLTTEIEHAGPERDGSQTPQSPDRPKAIAGTGGRES